MLAISFKPIVVSSACFCSGLCYDAKRKTINDIIHIQHKKFVVASIDAPLITLLSELNWLCFSQSGPVCNFLFWDDRLWTKSDVLGHNEFWIGMSVAEFNDDFSPVPLESLKINNYQINYYVFFRLTTKISSIFSEWRILSHHIGQYSTHMCAYTFTFTHTMAILT